MNKTILFSGGGTTGHVTKNLILLEALKRLIPTLERHYVGLKRGKEAELVKPDMATFHPISAGKLRRYWDVQNVVDFFRFLRGIWQSFWLVRKIRPRVVFSSGGFVALPVAIAARMNGIPVISHETDSYPGLANRLIARFADKVCLGYSSAEPYFRPAQTVFTGNPVSPALFGTDRQQTLKKLKFSGKKPVLLAMGGSQGAKQINELMLEVLPELCARFHVIHLTGQGKMDFEDQEYRPFEYVKDDYAAFLALADVVVTRAGGNSLAEIEALKKVAVMIPLPAEVAAGDHQLKNALEMLKRHPECILLEGEQLSSSELLKAVKKALKSSGGASPLRLQSSATDWSPRMPDSSARDRILEEIVKVL